MHDSERNTLAAFRQLVREVSELRAEIRQLRRAREPAVTPPPPKVFAVTNSVIAQGGFGTVERLVRNEDDDAWIRSGEEFTAHDIFFNVGEFVPTCYVVSCVPYEGKWVIDSIYCRANDWLEGCA